ncbi:MAG: transposase [Candidatus Competibacteraceae bacterium]|nr:transposase [Candidatus Competibacteraceae bacterium]
MNAAKEFWEKVQIVVDRFHVAKLYGKRLDELRKRVGAPAEDLTERAI